MRGELLRFRIRAGLVCALASFACSTEPPASQSGSAQIAAAPAATPLVPAVVTAAGNNVDSPAIWLAPQREKSLVLLSEKGAGKLMVFEASRQALLVRRATQMTRPNGIAILSGATLDGKPQDLAFVTDRDAHRVDVFTLPDLRQVGRFAQDVRQPMGIGVHRTAEGAVFAFVVPKNGLQDNGVVRYRIEEKRGRITGTRDLAFAPELTKDQESIWVDSDRQRVLVADETAQLIQVYGLDGSHLRDFGQGHFQAQVEGIVTVQCGDRSYVIAADQLPVTEFEIFDAENYEHLGMVRTAAKETDGIAVTGEALPGFPGGLFVAHSDPDDSGGRHAEYYDLREFLAAAGLPACR
jgi:3-phytase